MVVLRGGAVSYERGTPVLCGGPGYIQAEVEPAAELLGREKITFPEDTKAAVVTTFDWVSTFLGVSTFDRAYTFEAV